MKQKIFLTSALAMGVIAPAMAEPERVATFPNAANNEFMQENKVYTNAATETNMAGVYQDGATVNAVAQYTDILYNIAAGNYLEAGSDATNGTTCPAGSYCPGLTDALYNATTDQGINSCPSGYALSASGSSSQNECYRECTNADVEHSKGTMNGGYYYGDNNQCGATDCVNGWHLKSGISGSELASIIGNEAGVNSAYISGAGENSAAVSGSFRESASNGQSYYGLTDNNTWAVDYGSDKGMLIGQARCSTQSGQGPWNWSTNSTQNPTITANLADETGQEGAQYCYCNVTGYKDTNGNMQSVSSPWVYSQDIGSGESCGFYCAHGCVFYMRDADANRLAFRAAVLGSVQPGLAMCEANTITINWSDASAADISANNAGTATYGEDVRTPVKAATKKGKTFKGWRFSKPTETNLPE